MAPILNPGPAELEALVRQAAEALLKHDSYLLTNDVNERAITHRFAEHLRPLFPGWDVDCEYNRDGHDPKRLTLPAHNDICSDDVHASTVFPDIIIHHRGTGDNLVVIEVKKITNPKGEGEDLTKLAEFKNQLGYRVALFCLLTTGDPQPAFDLRGVG